MEAIDKLHAPAALTPEIEQEGQSTHFQETKNLLGLPDP
jgi:hypothetical protein